MSELGDKGKLKVGQFGYSLDTISDEKRGPCYFDGTRYDVKAGGDIRKWAEVIVITLTPEPTVIETWGVFPLSYGSIAGGFKTVSEDFPLPTTMGSKAVSWANINKTDASTTALVTPSPGKKVRIHYLIISNNQGAVVDVGITFNQSPSAAGDYKIRLYVPADGGTVPLNLTDANIEGAVDEVLYAYCAAAYASGVYFNVGYTEV